MALYRMCGNGVSAVPGREEMATVLSTDHGRFVGHGEDSAEHLRICPGQILPPVPGKARVMIDKGKAGAPGLGSGHTEGSS